MKSSTLFAWNSLFCPVLSLHFLYITIPNITQSEKYVCCLKFRFFGRFPSTQRVWPSCLNSFNYLELERPKLLLHTIYLPWVHIAHSISLTGFTSILPFPIGMIGLRFLLDFCKLVFTLTFSTFMSPGSDDSANTRVLRGKKFRLPAQNLSKMKRTF